MITLEQFKEFKKKKPKGFVFAINGDFELVVFYPATYIVRFFEDGKEARSVGGVLANQEYLGQQDFLTRDVFISHTAALNELGSRLAPVKYELKDPKEEEE